MSTEQTQSDPTISEYREPDLGLSQEVVRSISAQKEEPLWMLELRLKALECFEKKAMPSWGPDLSSFDLHNIHYYVKPVIKQQRSWDAVPEDIKKTFDHLGVPQAEQLYLAGLGGQ